MGLHQEPFVAGIPEMINNLVTGIPDIRSGFRLLFSSALFLGYQIQLTHVEGMLELRLVYRFRDDPGVFLLVMVSRVSLK